MKMSAEEIVIMYNQDRTRENMQHIADINGCTIREVGEFLKNASKKKPGRPKKDAVVDEVLSGTDETLKDDFEKLSNKSELKPEKKRTYIIPDVIVNLTKEKIEEYLRLAKFHEQKAEEYYLLANECDDFLDGGTYNGSKNGIHGEV